MPTAAITLRGQYGIVCADGRVIKAPALDLVSRGLNVDETINGNRNVYRPEPGYRVPRGSLADRLAELHEWTDTTAQRWHFRRGADAQERHHWLAVVARVDPRIKTFRAFLKCGAGYSLQLSPSTGQYRMTSPSCGNRFCPRCGRKIAREKARNIEALFKDPPVRGYKFLTISPAHTDEPLHIQLDHLTASFRRLRQQRYFANAALHGVSIVEVKAGQDGKWHPHLHIVMDAWYLNWHRLLDDCRTAFGRECSVDIRIVRNSSRAMAYVAKYGAKGCGKAADLAKIPGGDDEVYAAMYRRKTVWRWGKTAPKPAKPDSRYIAADDWITLFGFGQLCLALRRRDKTIAAILDCAGCPIRSLRRWIAQQYAPPPPGR